MTLKRFAYLCLFSHCPQITHDCWVPPAETLKEPSFPQIQQLSADNAFAGNIKVKYAFLSSIHTISSLHLNAIKDAMKRSCLTGCGKKEIRQLHCGFGYTLCEPRRIGFGFAGKVAYSISEVFPCQPINNGIVPIISSFTAADALMICAFNTPLRRSLSRPQ